MMALLSGDVIGFDADDEAHRCMPRAHFLS